MNIISLVHHVTGNNYLIFSGNSLGIIALNITLGRLLNTTLGIGDINLILYCIVKVLGLAAGLFLSV